MTAKNMVKIRIFDLPGINKGCACCTPTTCGPEYASVKNKAEELKAALEAAYPGRTATEYVDLLMAPQEKESTFGQLLATKEEPSPLVIIDGEMKSAGMVQVPVIVKEVGKILNG